MNLKRWSKEDIELLRKEYPFRLNNEISEIINRSVMAISYMAGKLGLKSPTDEKIYIISNPPKMKIRILNDFLFVT